MVNKATREKGRIQFLCIDDLVPQEHLVRKLEKAIDFDFIYDEVRGMYCEDNGRPSVDPVTLFKIVFVQYMFGIRSMRQTIREIQVNMAYRWFCNLDIMNEVPHFSTFGKNYQRRFKDSDIFGRIFDRILKECIEHGFVDTSSVFIDSTHIKASANKRKKVEEYVSVEAKNYQAQLDKEIDEERAEAGKKPLQRESKSETKKITKSTTDPDAGEFHKGEHERCFAYSAHTACDKKGFVIKTVVTPGNLHDSRVFSEVFQDVISNHEVQNVAVDAGYKTPAIAKEIIDNGKTPIMPYARPKGQSRLKPGTPKKSEYLYNKELDYFVSPDGEVFTYRTTDRNGYRQYKTPNNPRVLTRHIWQNYLDTADIIRCTPHGKEIYRRRKETIERVFGDAKEKHAMRWTPLRGLAAVTRQITLTFACMNLKKLATWTSKTTPNPKNPSVIARLLSKLLSFFKFQPNYI